MSWYSVFCERGKKVTEIKTCRNETKKCSGIGWIYICIPLRVLITKIKDASYIDILRRAEYRGIDIIAFTDHNSVGGYAAMMEEIDRLEFLEQSGRAQSLMNMRLLAEYRRLLEIKCSCYRALNSPQPLVFTSLGIFPPDTPIAILSISY